MKSCPLCRRRFSRVPKHLTQMHSDTHSMEDFLRLKKEEATRCREAGETSFDLVELQNNAPSDFLQAALMLVKSNMPVYIRESNVKVQHVTIGQIQGWIMDRNSMPPILQMQQPRQERPTFTATAMQPPRQKGPANTAVSLPTLPTLARQGREETIERQEKACESV